MTNEITIIATAGQRVRYGRGPDEELEIIIKTCSRLSISFSVYVLAKQQNEIGTSIVVNERTQIVSSDGQPNPPSLGGVGCADVRKPSRCLASTKEVVRQTYVTLDTRNGRRAFFLAVFSSQLAHRHFVLASCAFHHWLRTRERLRLCFKRQSLPPASLRSLSLSA